MTPALVFAIFLHKMTEVGAVPFTQGVITMYRFSTIALLAVMLGLVAGLGFPSSAHAQVVYTYSAPPPVVSYYPPVTVVTPAQVVQQPTISYYAPAPAVTYYQPAPTVTYYQPAPTVTYAPPPTTISYSYYPPTTVYAAPVYAPATVVTPGTVTTRSYFGLGILRPLGRTTESYYTPGYRSTYYGPYYP
jgi:hypothetical protein